MMELVDLKTGIYYTCKYVYVFKCSDLEGPTLTKTTMSFNIKSLQRMDLRSRHELQTRNNLESNFPTLPITYEFSNYLIDKTIRINRFAHEFSSNNLQSGTSDTDTVFTCTDISLCDVLKIIHQIFPL